MSQISISAGFIPLVDAAPLIIAKEMGFAEEEGLKLDLRSAPSWSTLRDMLAFGQIQAAQMLSPVPIASSMGLMSGIPPLSAVMVMSVNGTVFGVSPKMSELLHAQGFGFDFTDAAAAGQALAQLPRPLRIGVPFALSMHYELIAFWLSSCDLIEGEDFTISAVPPPLMAQAVRNGDLDAYCVGEPWGSVTVDTVGGALLLPGSAIWSAAPEKVLALRQDWAEENPEAVARLMRAVWRACDWLGDESRRMMASELLSAKGYLDVGPDLIDRSFTGRLTINESGDTRQIDNFVRFHGSDSPFPWKSQAAWIGERISNRLGLNKEAAMTAAQEAFRSDWYRENLADMGISMPRSSSKLEGATPEPVEASGTGSSLILERNVFFDGKKYDPSAKNA